VRTSRRLPLAATALAAVALVPPAAAQAKLPSPRSTLIVPNGQIGGVRLGGSIAAAKRAWGRRRGQCAGVDCVYQDLRRVQLGSAFFAFEDGARGHVTQVRIVVGHDPRTGKPVFRTPLARFKTAGGIGLGSSQRAVRRAYPRARTVRTVATFFIVTGRRGDQTLFEFERHRLASILIEDGRPRG
jgi:hypothetical protein